jgi:hypothetical protein
MTRLADSFNSSDDFEGSAWEAERCLCEFVVLGAIEEFSLPFSQRPENCGQTH